MTEYSSHKLHQEFLASNRKHILMITNHGIHQWDVVPGLPDTGGQNLFVNMFTETLASLGFRVTIVNRGGYAHPVTREMQLGLRADRRADVVRGQSDVLGLGNGRDLFQFGDPAGVGDVGLEHVEWHGFMGGIVALVAMSMFMPMFDLTSMT